MLLLPSLQAAVDMANAKIGEDRNQQKTEVIHYVSDLYTVLPEWKINEVHPLTSFDAAVRGNVTLGVAVGPSRSVADQLLAKADVVRDQQTEFALLGEGLGVIRFNHILRVHGHIILHEEQAAKKPLWLRNHSTDSSRHCRSEKACMDCHQVDFSFSSSLSAVLTWPRHVTSVCSVSVSCCTVFCFATRKHSQGLLNFSLSGFGNLTGFVTGRSG